jgi:hypothetical protein
MAKKLTDVGVRCLKPKPDKTGEPARTQYYFGDKLYVIVQPSGVKSFALRYRRDGRQVKHTLGQFFAGDISEAPEPKIGGLLTGRWREEARRRRAASDRQTDRRPRFGRPEGNV